MKTGADNEDVLKALIHLVNSTNDEPTRWVAIQTLGKLGSGNEAVFIALAILCGLTFKLFVKT